ncbi:MULTISPECIES: co-chaperone DjlA [Cellvibrio]|uniref:DnaJ like chaperone protein n=1 Tax=Cellvibrio fibrivorans TaxID=126350 RepID=A0ABU1V404_9GAMM|nr:co-chaperone DjlA [Cellvibrio fibrivorans]MDR7092175.1 DnaJ like chaperone protein [Cellvibrio fibrivorans]
MADKRQSIRAAFLKATFSFLGYIASCDGQINREEVNRIKVHMKKMHLSEDEQRNALLLFKSGTAPDFNASQALVEFRAATTPKLIQILLVHLLTMARADGFLMEKELHALLWVARELGYKSIVFNHLLKMIYEQDQLALSRNPPQPAQPDTYSAPQPEPNKEQKKANTNAHQPTGNRHQDLHKAYKILGVTTEMTEDEIRRAYKKLASQLHPDKLMSQGLAQEQMHIATERFKRVQAAYSFIKKHRSIYSAR